MSVNNLKGLFFLCFCLVASLLTAQNRSDLEAQKKENLKKIKETEKILGETANKRKSTVGQLQALNAQINERKNLIGTLNKEIGYIQGELNEVDGIIEALEDDLKKLKEEYAEMIYSASKASKKQDVLTFIFSADSFRQFLMRLKYMEQYAEMRHTQVEQIEQVQLALTAQHDQLEEKRAEQNSILKQQIQESDRLVSLQDKQNNVVKDLQTQEKELKNELDESKKAAGRLDKLIADLIKKEAEKSNSTKFASTPEGKLLSSSFAENKSRLLWPVETGFISSKFGKQPHPVWQGVVIDNSGIDIQTSAGQSVRAVFDGRVSAVANIKGIPGVVIIIQHGDYRTVYSNLKKANVKTGDQVKAKDIIGVVFTDNDGTSEVKFQVWQGGTKLNPQLWLASK